MKVLKLFDAKTVQMYAAYLYAGTLQQIEFTVGYFGGQDRKSNLPFDDVSVYVLNISVILMNC